MARIIPVKGNKRNSSEAQWIVGYCRVSTGHQATEGVSLDVQRQAIEDWAKKQGYFAPEIYVDAGISGKSMANRPEFQRALDRACEVRGILVVYSLSRMARSVRDAIEISEKLERSGADLVSITENMDTTTAMGRMVFQLMSVLAEFERELLGERIGAAMAKKRLDGGYLGRVPYGWDLPEGSDTLVENPVEQKTLREIVWNRARGCTFRAISGWLNKRGIPTKNGRTWHASTIKAILVRMDKLTGDSMSANDYADALDPAEPVDPPAIAG